MVMSTRLSWSILFSTYVGCTPLSPAEDPDSLTGTPPDQDPIEDTAPVDDGELSILTLDASGLHFSMDWYGQTTPEVGELRLSNTGTEDVDVLVEAPPWLLVEPSADTIPAEETVSVGLSVDTHALVDREDLQDVVSVWQLDTQGVLHADTSLTFRDLERPGPHNTGPTDPDLLVPSGSITVTTDGAVIENVDVTGAITVEADNVTIRNFRVNGGGYKFYGVNVVPGARDCLVEDGEIMNVKSSGVLGTMTARRLNIHDSQSDGLKMGSNSLVEGCWIHHLGTLQESHADGSQTTQGSNIVFRGNFFDLPSHLLPEGPPDPYQSHSCLMISATEGPISNVVIDSNWINGGAYAVYLGGRGDFALTNAQLVNNRFGRHSYYGVLALHPEYSGLTISGNVWDDTGELMDINGWGGS